MVLAVTQVSSVFMVTAWYVRALAMALEYIEFSTLDSPEGSIECGGITFSWKPEAKMLKIEITLYPQFDEMDYIERPLVLRIEQFTDDGMRFISEKCVEMISAAQGQLECYAPQSGVFRIIPV